MATHWKQEVVRNEKGTILGGPVELTWDHAGAIILSAAGPRSNPDLTFEPDDLESLWATIQDSGLNCQPEHVRLFGTERHDDGAGAHKAISGNIPRPRVDGAGNRKENAYSGAMVAKHKAVELQLRLMYGKPCLWAFQEMPDARKSGGNAKPKPALEIKRVSVGGNVQTQQAPARRGPQVQRSNRRSD